jgi:cell division protein FtsI (penicillin-binding protein 3)
MVNQPSYNPNDRSQFRASHYRNRAITDIFEPGSSIKPLVAAAALESGDYTPKSIINTSPGRLQVGAKNITDKQKNGKINISTMQYSSTNVCASNVTFSLDPAEMWGVFDSFGLGHPTKSGFPGESAGVFSHYQNWRPISQATLAYGYGLSITPLQLTQAYAVLGGEGLQRPVSLLKVNQPPIPRRVISAQSANEVLGMMEHVVAEGGTGTQAAVPGFRVAGKTGTTVKATGGSYEGGLYTAIFAGIAPASNPRLAVVVVIDEPRGEQYYGGLVAAPVFSSIVADATRVLAINPDALDDATDAAVRVALR